MKIHTLKHKSKTKPVFKHCSVQAYDPWKTSLKPPATQRLEENYFLCIQCSSSELQPFGSEFTKPQKDGNQPCQHLPRLQNVAQSFALPKISCKSQRDSLEEGNPHQLFPAAADHIGSTASTNMHQLRSYLRAVKMKSDSRINKMPLGS